jgi:hypothetical protein
MTSPAIVVSTFYGTKSFKDRSSEVLRDNRGFFVRLYSHESCVGERHLFEHSEVYAENTAENWVLGVIQ